MRLTRSWGARALPAPSAGRLEVWPRGEAGVRSTRSPGGGRGAAVSEEVASSLGIFSLSTEARRTYFFRVVQEQVFTAGMRKRSQILLVPPWAIPSRAPPALASFCYFPRYFLSSFRPLSAQSLPPLAAPRSDATGQQRVVLLGAERKVLPASAGASLLLSLGTSRSLGCAKRPLVVRFRADAFCAPGKASPLQG